MPTEALMYSDVPGLPEPKRGKVRDVYDLGDELVFVTTDRISAFDWVMPNGIPGKGKLLTDMSKFWFAYHKDDQPNHLVTADDDEIFARHPQLAVRRNILAGRTMVVRKVEVCMVEAVARGYLAGSGLKEYRASQTVCGIPLRAGLREADKLDTPIYTPATKAPPGEHDENISFERSCEILGTNTATEIRDRTLAVYQRSAEHAESRGIILADTKFEWGRLSSGELILIDEVLTPDSSRFWPKDTHKPGANPPSFDKQFLRDWLETTGWDKQSTPPELPAEVIEKTLAKYEEALRRLTA